MKDPLDQRIIELGWRQGLTEAQQRELQDYLAANPSKRGDWESESQLNQLLDRLPEAPPVASNFTAQVLSAIHAEARAASRARPGLFSRWRSWIPKFAVACLFLMIGLLVVHEQQAKSRELLARRVATVAEAVPDADFVRNFDAIRRLSEEPPKADTDLLALMQ